MSDIGKRWNLTPVINAAGTMTVIGASRVLPEVRDDVTSVLGRFVHIDELQARASEVIARLCGSEAGIVTSSAASGMALACAAAIVGEDLAAIDALPATGPRERRIAVQMGHMVNYGAPVAQAASCAGAEVVPLGTAALCELYHLEAALAQGLAAALYVVSHHTVREGELPLALFVEACRRHNVPVIVDMASEYDLAGAIGLGADVAIYSGHKFLSGATSGIVAGTRKIVRAIYLQNAGMGRLMKVGKEGIAGAISALEAWERRDHDGQRRNEEAIVDAWLRALSGIAGLQVARHADWTGNPITRVELRLEPTAAGLFAWELAERLKGENPSIVVRDDLAEHQLLYLDPCNLTADEAEQVGRRLRAVCELAKDKGDGLRKTWLEVKRGRGAHRPAWLGEGT